MTWFRNREEIAEYLRISRMTLSRWEKIVPLPLSFGRCHVGRIESGEINAWYNKLREKYRPYNSWSKGKITTEQ